MCFVVDCAMYLQIESDIVNEIVVETNWAMGQFSKE